MPINVEMWIIQISLALLFPRVTLARNNQSEVTVYKCCDLSKIFSQELQQCVPGAFSPSLLSIYYGDDALDPFQPTELTPIRYIAKPIHETDCHPSGPKILMPDIHPEDAFQLLANGTLFMPSYDTTLFGADNEYCLEEVHSNLTHASLLCVIICPHSHMKRAKSSMEEFQFQCQAKFKVYPVLIGVSIISLVVTVLVYSLAADLNNVPGKNVKNLAVALILSLTILFIEQLTQGLPPFLCKSIGYLMYLCFMSAFSWMTLLSYDVITTFRKLRPNRSRLYENESRYFKYQLIGWGGSVLLTLLALAMDLAPLPKQYTWMKPKIGLVSCWFAGDLAIVLYFYGPIGTMLLANVTLFVRVATAFSSLVQETVVLRKYSCATTKSTLRKHVSNSSHDQQVHLLRVRLILGLKLFCVMGLSWTFEIISWILSTSTPCWMWYVPDAINLLQGLWIFLIFGAKPKRLAEIFHKIFKISRPIKQVPPSLIPVPVHPEQVTSGAAR